ncbi:MAG: hypothetical protein JXA74_06510 [Anaerolineae bacterium]|nr:hypothetical protein [Anaerolineae bacterium]
MSSRLWSSRDRLLAAIGHQEADHVPLWFNWQYRRTEILNWDDIVDRADRVLDMGLDDTMLVNAPLSVDPAVTSQVWVEHPADSRYPLVHKVWCTPDGPLRQVVQKTDDWSGGDDVGLTGDLNVPRSLEFPIKTLADVERLDHFHRPPTHDQIARFRAAIARMKALDQRRGALIEGGWICLGDMPFWLLGAQGLIMAQADQPELVDALLEHTLGWERQRIALLLDAGVDIITLRAWYESTDFWGVAGFRRFLKPRLKAIADLVHAGGARFSYICTSGLRPRLDDLVEIGVDILWGVDPVQDATVDLELFKRVAGGRMCLLGGLNGTVTLVTGSEKEIRDEVDRAVRVLGPGGGAILSPIDNIFDYTPRQSLECLIDQWRRVRDYPIAV